MSTPVTKPAVTIVIAPESFDVYTAPEYRTALRHVIEHGACFVVADLAGVTFMDQAGIAVLVGALRWARAHDCGFGIACDRELILRMFRIMALDKVFDIRGSVDEFEHDETATAGEER